MKTLILTRGVPGCGKSTWIEKSGLKPYTISSDDIRLMHSSPEMGVDGKLRISQKHDKSVWETVFNLLEYRMKGGCLTVIDATHIKTSSITAYKKLCDKYGYKIFVKDFSYVPLEVCLKQNKQRPEFKQVPDDVIISMHSNLANTKIDYPEPDLNRNPERVDGEVFIFGDIHGCWNPLDKFFNKYPFSKDSLYIFTGDYTDRGIQNKEVIEFLLSHIDDSNVILLEGNHECLSTDTEVLTDSGWKLHSDIADTDKLAQYSLENGLISFDFPKAKIFKKNQKVVTIKGDSLSHCITPNHNIVYDGNKVCFNDLMVKKESISSKGFIRAANSESVGCSFSKDYVRLLTWVVCDGTIVYGEKGNTNNSKCRVQFKLSRKDKIDSLKNLLEKLNIKYTFHPCKKYGVNKLQPYYIRFYSDDARKIYSILGKNKIFPKSFLHLDKECLDALLDTISQTDGTISYQRLIWTSTCKENVDTIQSSCTLNNIPFSYVIKNKGGGFSKKVQYVCTIRNGGKLNKGNKNDISLESGVSDVFCYTMPEGTLVVRHNGCPIITGNCWMRHYVNGELDSIKSKEFLNHTLSQLSSFDKKDLSKICSKLKSMYNFILTRTGSEYVVTHGGIPNPDVSSFQKLNDSQYIFGVGTYGDGDRVDELWSLNAPKYGNIYSIHGHRNINHQTMHNTPYTYNLCDEVEFGGDLRVLHLTKEGEHRELLIKNDIYKKGFQVESTKNLEVSSNNSFLDKLNKSDLIVKKKLENNIVSYTFSRDAFYKKQWNELTCSSRGLFVHIPTETVVARGYDKFFNVNERKETEIKTLKDKLVFPVSSYLKYNGYLGLLSYNFVTDDFFISSKSLNVGDYASLFKEQLRPYLSNELKSYLKSSKVTMVFEVLEPNNDPHIIKNNKGLVLLDIIDNNFCMHKSEYEVVQSVAEKFGFTCKEKMFEISDKEEFESIIDSVLKGSDEIEGYVFEDSIGYMFKVKTDYYTFWKEMRRLKDRVAKGKEITCRYPEEMWEPFYKFLLTKNPEQLISLDIITLREEFKTTYE